MMFALRDAANLWCQGSGSRSVCNGVIPGVVGGGGKALTNERAPGKSVIGAGDKGDSAQSARAVPPPPKTDGPRRAPLTV